MKKIGVFIAFLMCVSGVLSAQEDACCAVPDSLDAPSQRASWVLAHFDAGLSARAVAEIAEECLFDPLSPSVDEEAYIIVADSLLAGDFLEDADRLRIEDSRAAAMLNRVGHAAADFALITRDGERMMLSEAVRGHRINVLMFYDPDCHDCAELERFLAESQLGDAGVVMVSPYGDQDGLWTRHAATMPAGWIVARPVSEEFDDEGLYDIRLTPTVYLLDSAATVLVKYPRRDNILKFIEDNL